MDHNGTDVTSTGYAVRESRRATHASLRVSAEGVLEVVIPRGFDRSLIPGILREKRGWIKRAIRRMEKQKTAAEAQAPLPRRIALQAIGEAWPVSYHRTRSSRVTVTQRTPRQLAVSGDVDHVAMCRAALRRWLARKARQHLVPWLRAMSKEKGLPFGKTTVRGQRTRWASCSARGTISINYKLLFVPRPLVRYVLIHELCHTRHMNHSPRFWGLLKEKEPGYEELRARVRAAWRHVPGWLQD